MTDRILPVPQEGDIVTINLLMQIEGSGIQNLIGSVNLAAQVKDAPEDNEAGATFALNVDVASVLREVADRVDTARQGQTNAH